MPGLAIAPGRGLQRLAICLIALCLAVPAAAQAPLRNALVDLQKGRYEEAAKGAETVLAANPGRRDKADALWVRAMARHGLHDYAAALKDLGQAIEIDPQRVPYREQRIRTALRLGRYDLVLKDFAQLEEPGGGFRKGAIRAPLMHLYRASARFETGNFAGAFADYEAALAAEPKNAAFLHAAAWAYATVADPGLRDAPRAVALAKTAAKLRNSAAAQNALGAAYAAMGEFDQAIDAYKAAMALGGKSRIERYQAYLDRLGYDVGGEQGKLGPKTRKALDACVRDWCQLLAQ